MDNLSLSKSSNPKIDSTIKCLKFEPKSDFKLELKPQSIFNLKSDSECKPQTNLKSEDDSSFLMTTNFSNSEDNGSYCFCDDSQRDTKFEDNEKCNCFSRSTSNSSGYLADDSNTDTDYFSLPSLPSFSSPSLLSLSSDDEYENIVKKPKLE